MEKSLFELSSVIHTQDEIRLTWPDLGGIYYVYRDDQLFYEGIIPSFCDRQFKQGKLYHYTIERVVDGVVTDVVRLQTTPYVAEKNVENPLQFLVMTTIIAQTQIALSWEMMKDVETYEIYRNDVFLGKVCSNQYIDRAIILDQPYVYRVQASRPLKKSEERFSKGKSIIAYMIGKFTRLKKETGIEEFVVMKEIPPLNELLIPVSKRNMKRKVNDWKFRYTTFLAGKTIKNPHIFSKNRYFQGDERGFNPESHRFRTCVDIALHNHLRRSPMTFMKRVGKTVAYSKDGEIREVAVASSNQIKLERIGETKFLLTHDVKNPLVQAPAINYEVHAILGQNGLFDITGFHNQAPHHEVYLMKDEGEWLLIYSAESEALIWMADVLGWRYWRHLNFH